MGAKYDRPFITHVNDSNGVWGKKVNKAENVTLNHKYLKIEEDILDTWNVFSLIALRFVNTSNDVECKFVKCTPNLFQLSKWPPKKTYGRSTFGKGAYKKEKTQMHFFN